MRSCICEVRNLPKSSKCQPLGHNLSHLVVASMVAVVGFQSAVVWLGTPFSFYNDEIRTDL